MNPLTQLIRNDMVPALGVTEPGAIAFITSLARSHTAGRITSVTLSLSSSIYKGAFTCGIPGMEEVGNQFAAALGACGGDHTKGLQALEGISDQAIETARKMVKEGKVAVKVHSITPDIYLNAVVQSVIDICEVTIEGTHTNVTEIKVNNKIIQSKELDAFPSALDEEPEMEEEEYEDEEEKGEYEEEVVEDDFDALIQELKTHKPSHYAEIRKYTLADLVNYVNTVPLEEIKFIKNAFDMNLALLEEGIASDRTKISKQLFHMNGGTAISSDELSTAQFITNTALEARVIGLSRPAMSITGSGAHGIICTLPLYSCCAVHNISEERLLRATALSYLVTIYIKEYSGILSAFCGCAIAAGTGAAVGLCYLGEGTLEDMERVINHMACSITGMICDGGNAGCTMKGITAVDAAYRAMNLAMRGAYIDPVHGICGKTPEQTMRNMGLIAYPGMRETEKTILNILEQKSQTIE